MGNAETSARALSTQGQDSFEPAGTTTQTDRDIRAQHKRNGTVWIQQVTNSTLEGGVGMGLGAVTQTYIQAAVAANALISHHSSSS